MCHAIKEHVRHMDPFCLQVEGEKEGEKKRKAREISVVLKEEQ